MNMPSKEDAEKCFYIRKQSKLGIRLHPDDQSFCERMFREFPEWYRSVNSAVFEETAPFGSNLGKVKNDKC